MNYSFGNFYGPEGVRVIDTIALRKRIGQDGRSQTKIAEAAGISVPTLSHMLTRGTASRRVIDGVRLALRPRMNFQTISPDELQDWWVSECVEEKHEKTKVKDEQVSSNLPKELAYYKDLSKDFDSLCEKYSALDVLEMANDYQFHILHYLTECDFDLSELCDEALNQIKSLD